MSSAAAMRDAVASLTTTLRHARTRLTPPFRRFVSGSSVWARRWGSSAVIGLGVVVVGVDEATRERLWTSAVTRLDPVHEWYNDRTQGRRKRHLLSHFGVALGGDVLELLPGAGGVFPSIDAIAKPELSMRSRPLMWRGIDTHSAHWDAGRLQRSASAHAGVPESQMQFDSCAARGVSMLQMLRDTPDASAQNVLALHGLSPLFTSSPSSHASAAGGAGASTPASQQELRDLLTEIHRVLKPGGRFIFMDEGAYPAGTFSRLSQESTASLTLSRLHPAGFTTPIEVSQSLPTAGFNEAHVEQWPAWVDNKNSRKGVRTLRVIEVDGSVQLDGLTGRHPLVVGVATKSAQAAARLPAEGNLGNLFGFR